MPTSIPARKKRLGNTTLVDAWKALKTKNKALGTSAYKPDITPLFAKYDQNLATYDKIEGKKDDLGSLTADTHLEPLAAKISGHYEELKKLANQWETHVKNSAPRDPENMLEDNLSDQFEFTENEIQTRRALWQQIITLEDQFLGIMRKGMDRFKSQNKAVADGVRKLEDECETLATHIHHLIGAYEKIAINQNDDDVVDALRTLLDKV
jgi:hypothetical protein